MRSANVGRALLISLAVVHTAALQWLYLNYISPRFAYQGMFTKELPDFIVVWQYVFVLIPTIWLPISIRKPSEFQALLIFVVVHVPAVVVGYHICREEQWAGYSAYLALSSVLTVATALVGRLRPMRLPNVALSPPMAAMGMVGLCVCIYASLLIYYGLPDDIFNVAEIYVSRAEFKEKALSAPAIVSYLYFWQGIVVNPFIMILGVLKRNPVLMCVGIALQYLLFAVTTLRSVALAIPFCIFIAYFFRKNIRWNGVAFSGLIVIAMLGGGIVMAGEGAASVAGSLFVQRWLTMQGQLAGAYFDFFVGRGKVYFGDAILHGTINYPYGTMTPGQIIGNSYVSFGHFPIDNAPANFLADAFAQFGYVGMVCATAVACLLLWLVDSVFDGLPRGVGIALFASCALTLTEQGIQTCILTGGILPLIVVGMLTYIWLDRVARA